MSKDRTYSSSHIICASYFPTLLSKLSSAITGLRALCFFPILLTSYSVTCQTWYPLGTGMGISNTDVIALDTFNYKLYAGGIFNTAGGITANNIAVWDGSNWSSLGSGISGTLHPQVLSICHYNGKLYVGGGFNDAGGISVNYIAAWDGANWSSVGSGVNAGVYAMAVYQGELYVGGNFSSASGIPANNIAKWNGSTWSSIGSGTNNPVNALTVCNGFLYVGGSFSIAGGNTTKGLAKWDGSNWSPVGASISGKFYALACADTIVYAAGLLAVSDGVGKWDGHQWLQLSPGSITASGLRTLLAYNSDLYLGGSYSIGSSPPIYNLARWDGNNWNAVAGQVNNQVNSLAIYNSSLCVGGNFSMIANTQVNSIARWDGISSIFEQRLNNVFAIYPNPNNGIFHITQENAENRTTQIYVYDLVGKIVYKTSMTINSIVEDLDLTPQPKGLYFVRSTNSKGESTVQKLVIE